MCIMFFQFNCYSLTHKLQTIYIQFAIDLYCKMHLYKNKLNNSIKDSLIKNCNYIAYCTTIYVNKNIFDFVNRTMTFFIFDFKE